MSFLNGGLADFATEEQWNSLMTEPIAEYTVCVKENGKKVAISEFSVYDKVDLMRLAREIDSLANAGFFPFVSLDRALNNHTYITE